MAKEFLMGMPAEMLAALRGDDEADEPTLPVMEAQADELRSRWASVQQTEGLQPGDLVAEKRGLGHRKAFWRKHQVMILWRKLDGENWVDRKHIESTLGLGSTDRPDCMVAVLTDEGTTVIITPHQLCQLTAWAPDP